MTAPVIVPDASVLLKWVLESDDEEDRDRALEIREAWLSGKCVIVLPSLWVFEVGNILGMKQPRLAEHLVKILIDYRFEEMPPAIFCVKALELMRKFKVTFYDAAYHAIALNRDGTFVTADNDYSRKTSKVRHVLALTDWKAAHLVDKKQDAPDET